MPLWIPPESELAKERRAKARQDACAPHHWHHRCGVELEQKGSSERMKAAVVCCRCEAKGIMDLGETDCYARGFGPILAGHVRRS